MGPFGFQPGSPLGLRFPVVEPDLHTESGWRELIKDL